MQKRPRQWVFWGTLLAQPVLFTLIALLAGCALYVLLPVPHSELGKEGEFLLRVIISWVVGLVACCGQLGAIILYRQEISRFSVRQIVKFTLLATGLVLVETSLAVYYWKAYSLIVIPFATALISIALLEKQALKTTILALIKTYRTHIAPEPPTSAR